MDALIIEAALNGVTRKERNFNVPITPDEVTAQGLAAFDAGAAIVHTHIDRMKLQGDEAVARYMESYGPILAARPDAILCCTVAAAHSFEGRFGHYSGLAASGMRMAVFDPGSVNLGSHGSDGLPGRSFVYSMSNDEIARQACLHDDTKLGPSIAIYEPGWLRTTIAYERAGKLPSGAFVKLYFGGRYNFLDGKRSNVTFGLPPTEKALDAYLEMLEGSALPWAVAAIGDCVIDTGLARMAIERGGHVRVGLEDFGGERLPTNIDLIDEVVAISGAVGRKVATPRDAILLLGLA